MRIGIDVRYLSHGLVGGVHTYLANIVPALIEEGRDHQVYLYADTKRAFELRDLPANVTIRYLNYTGPVSSVYHDLTMWRTMASDDLDVAHFPANYGFGPRGTRTVITVHDAINLLPMREIIRGHAKTARTIGMMTYLHVCTRAALRRAQLVFTVSSHAAGDIARHSGFDRRKIVPVYHAPAPDLQRVVDHGSLETIRRRYNLPNRFVLADGLKNPRVAVQSWQLLADDLRRGRELVFFSRRADVSSVVHEAVANGAARLLINPPRADLVALYSAADAFFFPSWMEGFGIPLLEAMTCGAPVIASDRGAIPEVVGNAALLADADDYPAFARYLTCVLKQPDLAEDLRERGFARASEFGWNKSAQQMLRSYACLA